MTNIEQIRKGDAVRVTFDGQVVGWRKNDIMEPNVYKLRMEVGNGTDDVELRWTEFIEPEITITSRTYKTGDIALLHVNGVTPPRRAIYVANASDRYWLDQYGTQWGNLDPEKITMILRADAPTPDSL